MNWINLENKFDSTNMKDCILSQSDSIKTTLNKEHNNIIDISREMKNCNKFIFTGSGDKYIVPLISKTLWDCANNFVLRTYNPQYLLEMSNHSNFFDKKTCVISVTQSGKTEDTLLSIKSLIKKDCSIIVITNLKQSTDSGNDVISMSEEHDNIHIIKTHTPIYPEIPTPSTMTFHASLAAIYKLIIELSDNSKLIDEVDTLLDSVSDDVNIVTRSDDVINWAKTSAIKMKSFSMFYCSGDGIRYPTAQRLSQILLMEGTKVNSSYIETESFVHSFIETLENNTEKNPLILLNPINTWINGYSNKNIEFVKKCWKKYAGIDKLLVIDPFHFFNDLSEKYNKFSGNILSPFFYSVFYEWFVYYLSLIKNIDPGKTELVKKVRSNNMF